MDLSSVVFDLAIADLPDDLSAVDLATTDAPPVVPKRIFVTTAVHNGNFGGLALADKMCQTLADAVPLGGKYKAWLGDSTASAASRLAHASVPYTLIDNTTVVAANWAGLTSGTLMHAIDTTEFGTPPSDITATTNCGPTKLVWTGTAPDGTSQSMTCTDWTAGATTLLGQAGDAAATTGSWTSACTPNCARGLHLYCVEQ